MRSRGRPNRFKSTFSDHAVLNIAHKIGMWALQALAASLVLIAAIAFGWVLLMGWVEPFSKVLSLQMEGTWSRVIGRYALDVAYYYLLAFATTVVYIVLLELIKSTVSAVAGAMEKAKSFSG